MVDFKLLCLVFLGLKCKKFKRDRHLFGSYEKTQQN